MTKCSLFFAACVGFLLAACGNTETDVPEVSAAKALGDYAPATVDRLMESCLIEGGTVAACSCLINAYRQKLDDTSVLNDNEARLAVRQASAADCGLASLPAPTPAPGLTADIVQAHSDSAVSPPAPISNTTPAMATRPLSANSPEVCLQDKLAAAEKGGSVSIEDFERFQRECGF